MADKYVTGDLGGITGMFSDWSKEYNAILRKHEEVLRDLKKDLDGKNEKEMYEWHRDAVEIIRDAQGELWEFANYIYWTEADTVDSSEWKNMEKVLVEGTKSKQGTERLLGLLGDYRAKLSSMFRHAHEANEILGDFCLQYAVRVRKLLDKQIKDPEEKLEAYAELSRDFAKEIKTGTKEFYRLLQPQEKYYNELKKLAKSIIDAMKELVTRNGGLIQFLGWSKEDRMKLRKNLENPLIEERWSCWKKLNSSIKEKFKELSKAAT